MNTVAVVVVGDGYVQFRDQKSRIILAEVYGLTQMNKWRFRTYDKEKIIDTTDFLDEKDGANKIICTAKQRTLTYARDWFLQQGYVVVDE